MDESPNFSLCPSPAKPDERERDNSAWIIDFRRITLSCRLDDPSVDSRNFIQLPFSPSLSLVSSRLVVERHPASRLCTTQQKGRKLWRVFALPRRSILAVKKKRNVTPLLLTSPYRPYRPSLHSFHPSQLLANRNWSMTEKLILFSFPFFHTNAQKYLCLTYAFLQSSNPSLSVSDFVQDREYSQK